MGHFKCYHFKSINFNHLIASTYKRYLSLSFAVTVQNFILEVVYFSDKFLHVFGCS